MTTPVLSRPRRFMWYILALVVVVLSLLAVLVASSWRRPQLGVENGRLRPCPASPNCVCSQETDADHSIPALPFDGDANVAIAQLRALMEQWPRTRRVTAEGNYLHVEVSTPLLGFVDDVEFLADPAAKVIQVRSASRVGHSDLGANRARVEEIRTAWRSLPPRAAD